MKLKLMPAVMALVVIAASALAQCAMCKANIANAENAADVSPRMNAAVLTLLIPTLMILGGLIRLIFKYRNFHHDPRTIDSSNTQRVSQQRQRGAARDRIRLHPARK